VRRDRSRPYSQTVTESVPFIGSEADQISLRLRTFEPTGTTITPLPSGSVFLPLATIVEGGKRSLPERVRCLHDLHVMKALEANVPPMSSLRGFFEALHFGIDFGHYSSRHAGIRRCTYFETSHGTF